MRSYLTVATPRVRTGFRRPWQCCSPQSYALLPKSLLLGPRFAVPIIELALLAALIATNPRRMVRQSQWSRIVATALAGLVIVANWPHSAC